jgi:hypothetical protein
LYCKSSKAAAPYDRHDWELVGERRQDVLEQCRLAQAPFAFENEEPCPVKLPRSLAQTLELALAIHEREPAERAASLVRRQREVEGALSCAIVGRSAGRPNRREGVTRFLAAGARTSSTLTLAMGRVWFNGVVQPVLFRVDGGSSGAIYGRYATPIASGSYTALDALNNWTGVPYYGTRGTYFADVTGDGQSDAIVVNEGGVTVRRALP